MPIKRNDRYELDPTEGKLIRIGHFLWRLYKREQRAAELLTACETVWSAKKAYRTELAARRERAAENCRTYWNNRQQTAIQTTFQMAS